MSQPRSIVIVGGGTAGWLTAAYLARALVTATHAPPAITLLESPDIATIGVGEGSFPTIRDTLRFLGIDEARFVRATGASFKQGIRFNDWLHAPENGAGENGRRHSYFHPFEPPFHADGANLVPLWLQQPAGARVPFAEAVTIQHRVAAARRAPKRSDEGDFLGPLNYAFHFDAARLGEVLAERGRELGVRHLEGRLRDVVRAADGGIDHLVTEAGTLRADLFVDCTGFRAELIGQALGSPFTSVNDQLFTDRAITCKIPYDRVDAPVESSTVATAHAAGWTWDIGLAGARGIGCVYSSRHGSDADAEAVLRAYVGPAIEAATVRRIGFDAGYRAAPWVGNCVAVGLAGGFLEPLESTGLVLIEAAVGMIAELFPRDGPVSRPARRFNELMAARYANIVSFLKLHYCLSRRTEPFWRDNTDPATIPERLRQLLDDWRYRPPSRFDFTIDVESFAFFNYQYILYGMEFATDAAPTADAAEADRLFRRIRQFGERAMRDLPEHRALIEEFAA